MIHCDKKYQKLHNLVKGADSVKHFLNPQTKQNCKSVAHLTFKKEFHKKVETSFLLFLHDYHKEQYVFLIDTIAKFIRRLMYNPDRIMLHAN